LNREAREGILEVEKEIHKRTGVNSTRFKQKNENGSKCIGLCDKRDIIYGM